MESTNQPTQHQYRPKKGKYGIVIDWETTGCAFDYDNTFSKNIKTYQGISVGLVIFDLKTLDPVDAKYILIQYDPKYTWDKKAEAVHGLSIDYLKENGLKSVDAAREFASFILQYFTGDEPLCVMGHNVAFDIAFCRQLLEPFGIMFIVDNTLLDTSTASFLMFGLHRSDDMFSFLGFEARKDHNALEDALMELEAMKRCRMIFQLGLGN